MRHNHDIKLVETVAVPFRVLPAIDVVGLRDDDSPGLRMSAPEHWRSPVDINPHSAAATKVILAWFEELGCSRAELARAQRFDIGGYVGMPFPALDLEQTTRIGKYLALWLLWDDVHVEKLAHAWRIAAADVHADRRPSDLTRFDEGWWQLMREFRDSRSVAWIERLCRGMHRWSDAATEEALLEFRHRESGELPSFAEQLKLRIETIGMYGVADLLEEIHDDEPPPAFGLHPIVQMLRYLANKIVGLDNDIFSFAKDHVEGKLNLVSTLMHERSVSVDDALAMLIRLRDHALEQYDQLAARLTPWATAIYPGAARWIHDLRISSLGFGLWEAQAPRYTAYQIVRGGRVLRPRFPARLGASPGTAKSDIVPTLRIPEHTLGRA